MDYSMLNPQDYRRYTVRQPINCNEIPGDYEEDAHYFRVSRAECLELLKHPALTQEQRGFLEMRVAKISRWLRKLDEHRKQFKLARLRLLLHSR